MLYIIYYILYIIYQHPLKGFFLEAFADLKVAGGDPLEGAAIYDIYDI